MNCSAEEMLHAGCSALSWSTEDGKKLWGRNLDFSAIAPGTGVTYVPRGTSYHINETDGEGQRAAYACLGMGILLPEYGPLLFEGVNEHGLMGGQLYYRGFAYYSHQVRRDTLALQPPAAVYHVLSQCATVEEAAAMLTHKVTLVDRPLLGTVPPLHWSFCDRSGETIVVEPDQDGLKVYRDTLGVMTNSPGYGWHRLNLLNYAGVRDLDYDGADFCGEHIEECFSGTGVRGLPGDWSSPSRFVRLAVLKKYAVRGTDEPSGVSRMFHLFQSAAFPLGLVRLHGSDPAEKQMENVRPYDYTVYTGIMCAQSLRYYWTTYENQRIQCVDLHHLMKEEKVMQFDLGRKEDFCLRSTAQK